MALYFIVIASGYMVRIDVKYYMPVILSILEGLSQVGRAGENSVTETQLSGLLPHGQLEVEFFEC